MQRLENRRLLTHEYAQAVGSRAQAVMHMMIPSLHMEPISMNIEGELLRTIGLQTRESMIGQPSERTIQTEYSFIKTPSMSLAEEIFLAFAEVKKYNPLLTYDSRTQDEVVKKLNQAREHLGDILIRTRETLIETLGERVDRLRIIEESQLQNLFPEALITIPIEEKIFAVSDELKQNTEQILNRRLEDFNRHFKDFPGENALTQTQQEILENFNLLKQHMLPNLLSKFSDIETDQPTIEIVGGGTNGHIEAMAWQLIYPNANIVVNDLQKEKLDLAITGWEYLTSILGNSNMKNANIEFISGDILLRNISPDIISVFNLGPADGINSKEIIKFLSNIIKPEGHILITALTKAEIIPLRRAISLAPNLTVIEDTNITFTKAGQKQYQKTGTHLFIARRKAE